MKQIFLITISLISFQINSYSQTEKKSFNIDDIILVANSKNDKAYEFLKSRHFSYIKKDSVYKCYVYALNFDKYNNSAKIWVYKFDNGKLKIQSPEIHRQFIEKQLSAYKKSSNFADDGTVSVKYFYKGRPIEIVVNDTKDISDIYVD